jgi:hypothetical protein
VDLHRQETRWRIIRQIFNEKDSPLLRNVVSLCEILIAELREANDEAKGDEFLNNQGGIQAYKRFVEYATKPIPEERSAMRDEKSTFNL